ncbi:MAG: CaiB/BaiF CoA transferase family protein, partial [Candidatus Binatia bacterium]
IMLSTCLMGQSGPLAKFAGFGNLAAAISGFYNITGWPDRPPSGPFSAYTDYVAPRFNAAAILAALEYRRRTGQGQYIDVSQAEAALHFLGPAILDYTANGRVQKQAGNHDLNYAPHGVYPVAGKDCWIAIVAKNDEQWQALCAVMGRPELLRDGRFTTLATRLAHQDDLDIEVEAWTKEQDPFHAEAALQARGVPSFVVRNMKELYEEPQLNHRRHFVPLDHPEHGKTLVEGSRFQLSRTPAEVKYTAPTLGRDNHDILEKILGYDEDKISELVVAGALG